MSNNADLLNVLYTVEGSYAENLATFGTSLPLIDNVDLTGLAREMQAQNFTRQYAHEGYQSVLMPYVGKTIKLAGRLSGLGSTGAGAAPASDMVTFLGLLVGASATGLATGTTFTGGTANVPTTTAASGVAAGGLVHGGALGDSRVNGQWLAVATHAANSLTLLLAAPAAPNNGDVLFASRMIHPNESPITAETLSSFRMQVLTSNGHFNLRGCSMADFKFVGLSPGEIYGWEATIAVAHVATTSGTFPNATVAQKHSPAPVANGSFVIQQVGTVTRVTELVRSFTLTLNDVGECHVGTGGALEGQLYQSCKRKPGMAMLDLVVDAEATGTYTWRDRAEVDPNSRPFWHALYSLSVADGRAVGIYFPRLRQTNHPIQINDGGWNRTRLQFEALKGATDTSELTRSAWRMGFA